ncbi:hypothetical protein [Streptomyces cyaneofuscatus]
MVDSDDVLLLRGPGFPAPSDAGPVAATICHPTDPEAFTTHVEDYVQGELPPGTPRPQVLHRTEHAENTFPALPVRTSEDVLLWFTPGEAAPLAPDLARHLKQPPQQLRLAPVHHLTQAGRGGAGGEGAPLPARGARTR